MKSKGLQPRLPYPAMLPFTMERKIRAPKIATKKWVKEYNSTKPAFQMVLVGLLSEEEEIEREKEEQRYKRKNGIE